LKREDLKIIYALSKKYISKHLNNIEEVPTYAILAERFDIPKHRVGKIMKELRKEGAI
jgi:DNA-binding IscR family transcriptional regulator